MFWRVFTFLFFQAVGAAAGWVQLGSERPALGALIGVVGGGLIWLLIDVSRGVRLLRWLRFPCFPIFSPNAKFNSDFFFVF